MKKYMFKINTLLCSKVCVFFFLMTMFSTLVVGQRQRNYVYIFDCTKSMEIPNKIWEPAKDFLKTDLEQLDKNATVTVVLFHQNASSPISFKANDYSWKEIENKCDNLIQESTHTGICNAWDKGLQYLDKNRNNYFYLFTDGKENVIKPHGTDAVCKRIQDWCKYSSQNDYAFFVSLPSKDLLNSPEVQRIKEATKSCERTFFISGKIAPFGSFDRTSFSQNSHAPKNITVGFSDYGTFPAKIQCSNAYYEIKLKGGKIVNGKAKFEVKQKKLPSQDL